MQKKHPNGPKRTFSFETEFSAPRDLGLDTADSAKMKEETFFEETGRQALWYHCFDMSTKLMALDNQN